jgi:hypothetical protein
MDKWLEEDLQAFCKVMERKGYTEPFLVNNSYSGELLAAIKECINTAEEQGDCAFPLILNTMAITDDPISRPFLQLRCDCVDEAIKIRNATIETVIVEGVTKYNVDVRFTNTEDFPSVAELEEKLKKRFIKKKQHQKEDRKPGRTQKRTLGRK